MSPSNAGLVKRTLTILLAVAVVLAGCGGDEGAEDDSEEAQVRQALEDFSAANLEGDWKAACDLMTGQLRRDLAEVGAARGEPGGCEATLRTGVGEVSEAQLRRDFEDVEVTEVKVNERQLTATAKVNGEITKLVKNVDGWRVGN